MFKGGQWHEKHSIEFIRVATLITPIVLIVYGLLARGGIVDGSHYHGDLTFAVLSIGWFVFALTQKLHHNYSQHQSTTSIILYHILVALYVVFVSGFSSPFIVCALILFLVTGAYSSRRELRLGIITLVLAAIVDSVYWLHRQPNVVPYDLISLVIIILGAVIMIRLIRSQDVDKAELSKSQAQENLERERLLTLINNLADAVLSTDKHGIIHVYNAASLNLLDTNGSLDGHRITEILPLKDGNDTSINLLEEFKRAKSVVIRDDLYYSFSETETIRLELTYSPIRSSYDSSSRNEQQNGYIIILRDITKQKSLEEERDEFISVVSHELRTPITIVEGTLSNTQLMMERGNAKPAVLKDAINTAHDQVIYLAKMVNDLSTLSRAERGVADTPEKIDVKDLVHALYKQYEDEAHKKGLQFNLDADQQLGTITVSRLYVEELLQNFITNAIKYTVEGSLTLSAHTLHGRVTFAVKDSGIGMTKSDQKRIFDKFYRAEDYRTRETNGTGLGLYVAAKLARKIGTKIELTSRLNHGSSFAFSLPLDEKNT